MRKSQEMDRIGLKFGTELVHVLVWRPINFQNYTLHIYEWAELNL